MSLKLSQITSEATTIGATDRVYIVQGGISKYIDGTSLFNILGNTSSVDQPVENTYADIAALLADQANQTTGFLQKVEDASADPNVASGRAYYEKLASTTGTLATDYTLLSDAQATAVDTSDIFTFQVQSVATSVPSNAGGGKIRVQYENVGDTVEFIIFNSQFSDYLTGLIAAQDTYGDPVAFSCTFYNTTQGVAVSFLDVDFEATGNYVKMNAQYADVARTNFVANDIVKVVISAHSVGGGGSSPLTTKGDIYTYSTVDARLPVGTNGQVLSADSTEATGLKWIAAGGTGTVTSVAVSGSDGIEVDSGSPITTSGTIALGINAGTLRTHINVEDGADVTDAVNVGSSMNGATAKTTPVDADTMPLNDSADSNLLKKVTWANIKATLKTYFDTLYPNGVVSDGNVSSTHNLDFNNKYLGKKTMTADTTFSATNVGAGDNPILELTGDFTPTFSSMTGDPDNEAYDGTLVFRVVFHVDNSSNVKYFMKAITS